MMCAYRGLLFRNKKTGNSDPCYNRDPIVIVVDGRNVKSKLVSGAVSKGVTASQQYQLALRYNCQDLVNADGTTRHRLTMLLKVLNNMALFSRL